MKNYILGFISGLMFLIGVAYGANSGSIGSLFVKNGNNWFLDGGNILNNSIDSSKIIDNSIGESKITQNQIDDTEIEDYSLTSLSLKNDSITNEKINNGAVTSSKIFDGTIKKEDLGNNSVGPSKIDTGEQYLVSGLVSNDDVGINGNLYLSGSFSLNGNINLSNKKITGVANPTSSTDAVNKEYVDNIFSSSSNLKVYSGYGTSDCLNGYRISGRTKVCKLSSNEVYLGGSLVAEKSEVKNYFGGWMEPDCGTYQYPGRLTGGDSSDCSDGTWNSRVISKDFYYIVWVK